jgi:hypothetical protein
MSQKIKFLSFQNENILLETSNGLKFPVPINFIIGLGNEKSYKKETYIDFIRKEMLRLNIYIPFDLC